MISTHPADNKAMKKKEKKIIIPGNTIIIDPYVTSFYQD